MKVQFISPGYFTLLGIRLIQNLRICPLRSKYYIPTNFQFLE
ncbi:uncharacterized protein METZ01_LOCUS446699, partial [marine metagenome]